MATNTQVRDTIDSGRTGEKVGAAGTPTDPAAAPMETGAEASGTPTDPAAAQEDLRESERLGDRTRRVDTQSRSTGDVPAERKRMSIGLGIGLAVVVVAIIIIALAMLP